MWGVGEYRNPVAYTARPGFHPKKKTLIAQANATRRPAPPGVSRSPWFDPTDGFFLDETGVSTKLVPTFARAPRGTRAVGSVPQARHHRSTLLATLTTSGMGACVVFKGALDQVVFDAFVDQFLVPALIPGRSWCSTT